jgi:Fe-S oxidoreductase
MTRIKENSLCCGSGGGVKTAYPEMAIAVAELRLEEAREVAGADTVVSCCPFCEINLGHAAAGKDFQVVDLLDLVNQAIGD